MGQVEPCVFLHLDLGVTPILAALACLVEGRGTENDLARTERFAERVYIRAEFVDPAEKQFQNETQITRFMSRRTMKLTEYRCRSSISSRGYFLDFFPFAASLSEANES